MIEVRGLEKRFGDVTALDGVSFAADDGSITGILGPNGAGKTTALRAVYAALVPDAGEAFVDGVSARTDPRGVQAKLGVVPHQHGLYPRLTPREHVAYFGRLRGLDDATLKTRTQQMFDVLDMDDIADRRTAGFSQGQGVKVAIARALVHEPQNVILDEPTSGLDVMSTRAMRDFIKSLRSQGRCVLFSSHIMQEVAALCDRVVVISAGRVVASGTKEELLESTGQANLEDAFVAALGSGEGLH